jgi:hypothetical protein
MREEIDARTVKTFIMLQSTGIFKLSGTPIA